jgi:hypothetical protein
VRTKTEMWSKVWQSESDCPRPLIKEFLRNVGKGLRKERAQKRMNRVKDVAQWLGTCPNMCHVQGHGLCPCTRKQNNRKNGQILGTKSTDTLLSTFAARQRRW